MLNGALKLQMGCDTRCIPDLSQADEQSHMKLMTLIILKITCYSISEQLLVYKTNLINTVARICQAHQELLGIFHRGFSPSLYIMFALLGDFLPDG